MDEGKILVVVLVLLVVFLGIAALMFYIERRLSKLEKKVKEFKGSVQSSKLPDQSPSK